MSLEEQRKQMYQDFGISIPESGLKTAKSGQEQIADFFGGLWNDFTGKTNNQMNLDFQRENLDYQKAIQQQIFEREDTAYQRTVNDMRASGLNPLSMNGTNGAGEAIATEPLQTQKTSDLQAMSQILDVVNQISNTRSNASVSQAQSNLINAQADNQRIKNLFETDIIKNTLESIKYENVGKRFRNEMDNINLLNSQLGLNFNLANGLTDNMPGAVKMALLTTGKKSFNTDYRHNFPMIDKFGKGFSYFSDSPNYDLNSSQLHGAIIENSIINGLLNLLNRIPLGGK